MSRDCEDVDVWTSCRWAILQKLSHTRKSFVLHLCDFSSLNKIGGHNLKTRFVSTAFWASIAVQWWGHRCQLQAFYENPAQHVQKVFGGIAINHIFSWFFMHVLVQVMFRSRLSMIQCHCLFANGLARECWSQSSDWALTTAKFKTYFKSVQSWRTNRSFQNLKSGGQRECSRPLTFQVGDSVTY